MSKAQAVMTDHAVDAHEAGRAALGIALALALLAAAVLALAHPGGAQAAPDESAQVED